MDGQPDPRGRDATGTEGAFGARLGGDTRGGLSPSALHRLVEAMPKVELHLHLDGAVLPATALWIARTRGVDAPRDFAAMAAALVAPMPCRDQDQLIDAFDLPVALMQDADALARIARELVELEAASCVRYAEIRWAPALHTAKGLSTDDVIAAVCDGTAAGAATTGVTARLICTAMRSHEPAANVALAESAARFRDRGMVGFDLAGREERYPDASLHRAAFDAARADGLRITLHAGEWGGAAQVRRALALDPERIAHGPGAADDPALVDELRSRGVVLDLTPTSNVQAGIVPDVPSHPLARLHRAGVPVTLSTDDPTVADIRLTDEYERAVREIGLTPAELWAIDRRALDVAFADETALAPLRVAFDAWAAEIPELAAG
jgi:adenosine deaminase